MRRSRSQAPVCPGPRLQCVQVPGSSVSRSQAPVCPGPRLQRVQVPGSSVSRSQAPGYPDAYVPLTSGPGSLTQKQLKRQRCCSTPRILLERKTQPWRTSWEKSRGSAAAAGTLHCESKTNLCKINLWWLQVLHIQTDLRRSWISQRSGIARMCCVLRSRVVQSVTPVGMSDALTLRYAVCCRWLSSSIRCRRRPVIWCTALHHESTSANPEQRAASDVMTST